MPLYFRNKTLLFKIETTEGTDAVPTGAVNAILATDISIMPMEGQDTSRNLELPWMGADGTVVTGKHAKISFKVELKGSGAAGTPPVVGPLLRACAMAEVIVAGTSVTYNRVSTAHPAATIHLNIDGTRFALVGSKGNCKLVLTAQQIVYLEFEFTGRYVQPTAQALPTAVIASQLSDFPQVATSANTPTFTIGGAAHVLRSFSLDWGNQVSPRLLVGSEAVVIENFRERAEATIEAVPLATLNPFALAETGTTQAVILAHGTGAGRVCTLTLPRAQFQRPGTPGQNQGIVEWTLGMVPLSDTGNDQLTLAFT